MQRRGGKERLHEICNSMRDPLLTLGLWLIRAKKLGFVFFVLFHWTVFLSSGVAHLQEIFYSSPVEKEMKGKKRQKKEYLSSVSHQYLLNLRLGPFHVQYDIFQIPGSGAKIGKLGSYSVFVDMCLYAHSLILCLESFMLHRLLIIYLGDRTQKYGVLVTNIFACHHQSYLPNYIYIYNANTHNQLPLTVDDLPSFSSFASDPLL